MNEAYEQELQTEISIRKEHKNHEKIEQRGIHRRA